MRHSSACNSRSVWVCVCVCVCVFVCVYLCLCVCVFLTPRTPRFPCIRHPDRPTRIFDAESLDIPYITLCHALMPEEILLPRLRPQAHKHVFILLEPRLVGHTSSRRLQSSILKIYIKEWKCTTENKLKETRHLSIQNLPLSPKQSGHIGLKLRLTPSMSSSAARAHSSTPSSSPISRPYCHVPNRLS
jgi:hypothetical protein